MLNRVSQLGPKYLLYSSSLRLLHLGQSRGDKSCLMRLVVHAQNVATDPATITRRRSMPISIKVEKHCLISSLYANAPLGRARKILDAISRLDFICNNCHNKSNNQGSTIYPKASMPTKYLAVSACLEEGKATFQGCQALVSTCNLSKLL